MPGAGTEMTTQALPWESPVKLKIRIPCRGGKGMMHAWTLPGGTVPEHVVLLAPQGEECLLAPGPQV